MCIVCLEKDDRGSTWCLELFPLFTIHLLPCILLDYFTASETRSTHHQWAIYSKMIRQ